MNNPQQLITNNLDIWTAAIKKRGSQGRGSSKKIELHGIKKLRELILELAVRGLLLPQNPNDEPASVLLEKIAAEKAQLIKDKKIKKPKNLNAISKEEMFGKLPQGWEYVRLNDLGEWGAGATPRRGNAELYGGSIPWFKSGELVGDYIDSSEETVTQEALKQSSLRLNKVGDVLLAMYGATIGKTSILKVEATTNQAVCACTTFSGFSNVYLLTLLKAYKPRFIGMGAGGAQPNISREKIIATVIAVPPEAEQPRIVAKVDELMALCDQLEQQTEDSLTAHQTLVETLLNSLLDAAQTYPGHASDVCHDIAGDLKDAGSSQKNKTNSAPFQQAWQRIWDNFDVLFVTEHSIDQLKQTILQLAVMGKLVPQNPNDEPASVLLEKIAAEKEQLIKDKKIKKQKPLPEISEDEKPFELPKGWGMVRFEDIADIQSGITKGRKLKDRETTVIPYLSVANVQRSYLVLEPIKEVEIPIEEVDKYRVLNGDLLITEGGDWDKVGRTAVWRDELAYVGHQNHVFKARKFLEEQSELWLEKYLNCPFSRDYFAGSSKQTTNLASINKTQLRGCLIAVPPAEEKNRIVAKVDELMAQCDTLKERILESQTTQLHLADAMAEQALS